MEKIVIQINGNLSQQQQKKKKTILSEKGFEYLDSGVFFVLDSGVSINKQISLFTLRTRI